MQDKIHASALRVAVLTTTAMLAFAGNSLLCRLALRASSIDAATFTAIRIAAGSIALWLTVRVRGQRISAAGNWVSALALFAYAAAFSYAYLDLSTGTGALLLFGAVQVTMIGYGLFTGEQLNIVQWSGLTLALVGLIWLLLPGLSAPPLVASLLMILAGAAWGIYSLRGRGAGNATLITAGNFIRAAPMAAILLLLTSERISISAQGAMCAIASGALTSGVGYAIWYTAVQQLSAARAATVQLSVPVVTAVAGVVLLSEAFTLRLVLASVAVLGGIALIPSRRADHERSARSIQRR